MKNQQLIIKKGDSVKFRYLQDCGDEAIVKQRWYEGVVTYSDEALTEVSFLNEHRQHVEGRVTYGHFSSGHTELELRLGYAEVVLRQQEILTKLRHVEHERHAAAMVSIENTFKEDV